MNIDPVDISIDIPEPLWDDQCLYVLAMQCRSVTGPFDLLVQKVMRLFRYGKFTSVRDFCFQAFRPRDTSSKDKWDRIHDILYEIYVHENSLNSLFEQDNVTLCFLQMIKDIIDPKKMDSTYLKSLAVEHRDHNMMSFLCDNFGLDSYPNEFWKSGMKYFDRFDVTFLDKLSPTKIKCLLWDKKITGSNYLIYVENRYGQKDMFNKLAKNKVSFDFPAVSRYFYPRPMVTEMTLRNLWPLVKHSAESINNFVAFAVRYYGPEDTHEVKNECKTKVIGDEFMTMLLSHVSDLSGVLSQCNKNLLNKLEYSVDVFNKTLKEISTNYGGFGRFITVRDEYPNIDMLLGVDIEADWSLLGTYILEDFDSVSSKMIVRKMLYSPGVPVGALKNKMFDIKHVNDQKLINELYLQGAKILTKARKTFIILGKENVIHDTYLDTNTLWASTQRYLKRFDWRPNDRYGRYADIIIKKDE